MNFKTYFFVSSALICDYVKWSQNYIFGVTFFVDHKYGDALGYAFMTLLYPNSFGILFFMTAESIDTGKLFDK